MADLQKIEDRKERRQAKSVKEIKAFMPNIAFGYFWSALYRAEDMVGC